MPLFPFNVLKRRKGYPDQYYGGALEFDVCLQIWRFAEDNDSEPGTEFVIVNEDAEPITNYQMEEAK